jgi:tetratricopeptide (TPR) repeat protein
MRRVAALLIAILFAGCNPEKKAMSRIESLQQAPRDTRYEIGMTCMQYILKDGSDLAFSKVMAKKLLDVGFYPETASAVRSLMEKYPDDAELFYLRGVAYRRLHQYDLALENGIRASGLQPDNKTFSAELAATRAELKAWNEIQSLNEALPNSSDSFNLLLSRAVKFYSIQSYDAVIYDLGTLSKMGSKADSIYYNQQVKSIYKDASPIKVLEETLDHFRRRLR